jgi:hypothetical protein
MTCERCKRHHLPGDPRRLKFRRGRGVADPVLVGGEFLARVDRGIIRFTWDFYLCDDCDRADIYNSIPVERVTHPRWNNYLAEDICGVLFFAWHKPGVADHCRWIAGQLQKLLGVGNE